MDNEIQLPKVTVEKENKAHPYPYQISLQTLEMIQATIFWHICADTAAGKILRTSDGITRIEQELSTKGMPKKDWEEGWEYLYKYINLFEGLIFKDVLVSMRSYWDWYINKLAQFVIFGQNYLDDKLPDGKIRLLKRITFKEINEQISIIENSCSLDLKISDDSRGHIKEMSLVRNLGLHNRWEVDELYIQKTLEYKRWQIGEIRVFSDNDLRIWHKSLSEMINQSCKHIAIKYVSVPTFPTETLE